MKINTINLPIDHNGDYILTEQAVALIRKAISFHLSFKTQDGQRVEEECYILLDIPETPDANSGTIQQYKIPINVKGINTAEADWSFSFTEYLPEHGGSPLEKNGLCSIQSTVQAEGCIEFTPQYDLGASFQRMKEIGDVIDVIRWKFHLPNKEVNNFFDLELRQDFNRIVRKTDRS